MKVRRFEWEGAADTAATLRDWVAESAAAVDVGPIEREVRKGGDAAVLDLTARFDATEAPPQSLRVDPAQANESLASIEPVLREALETAAANVRAVAEAQLAAVPARAELPQGQTVTIREVAVGSAGIYAPGGRAGYPSSVLMCAIPAQVAGVKRVALRRAAASTCPRRGRALRVGGDLRDGWRPGDLRPRLRH
jgi:histidinol dehydrogenase